MVVSKLRTLRDLIFDSASRSRSEKFSYTDPHYPLHNPEKTFVGMSFFVDVVTEDTFYENLTLGVVKVLENSPCVKNVQVNRESPCERTAISAWEQRHCCALPEDLRSFYSSIDGFLLTWNLEIAGETYDIGRMEINKLSSLKRLAGPKEPEPNSSKIQTKNYPSFTFNNKLFEIAQCGTSKIVLAYLDNYENPNYWLHHNPSNRWYSLANNFTKYFRTMLVHLGLPFWQHCVAGISLPMWVEQIYLRIGPHLLSNTAMTAETESASFWNGQPLNTIDPSIFKGKENKQRSLQRKK